MRLTILCIFCLATVILAIDMDSESLQEQYEKEQYNIRKKICLQSSEYGKCKGRRKLWFYNPKKFKCQVFIYSNCGGNGNLFYTQESCIEFCGKYDWKKIRKTAFCYLAYEFGKCGGHRVMWAFSIKELECVPFVFSNCGGNENRFHTKENCEKACAPIQSRFVLAY
ncbi:GM26503 [Drosophila sechellia]|uniref:GM26503 n=1 Tax=Drosophila sechellia TaxID=7238 RepID=B4HFE9_DROSE|nr:GM26503 [Drosophila sechellia]